MPTFVLSANEEERRHLMTVADAIEAMRPSVVQISYEPSDVSGWSSGSLGTGFLVNADAYVITARHVIIAGQALLAQITAQRKRMLVGLAIPNTEMIRGSFSIVEFDVIDEDPRHDLALLKLRRNPFAGEVTSGIRLNNEQIPLPANAATLSARRPRDGEMVAISGYPLGQPVLVTNTGWMATSWSYDVAQVGVPGGPAWFRRPDVADAYLADVTVNPGNSGGPVYLTETGTVIGVCVASLLSPVRNQEGKEGTIDGQKLLYSSGLTIVVPAQYAIDLLKKHGLGWSTAN
jgi:S1-C subfamily serine protease